jgi:signal transduction histidine kinase/ActR/RegA family two-component response regulator
MVPQTFLKPEHRGWKRRYSLALLAVLAVTGMRWLLNPWAGTAFPLALYFAAVGVAVWYGGVGPAIVASLAGYVIADYLFIEPLQSLSLESSAQTIGLLSYLFSCGVIILFARATRAADERFRLSQDAAIQGYYLLTAVRDRASRIVDFRWTYINPVGARLLGHTPEEMVGQRLLDFLPQEKDKPGLFEAMREVVDTGRPLDVEVHYDFGDLKGWFRNMIVKLDDGVAASFTDITERKTLEMALARQADELRQSDRRKTEFLAILAHELRNPLAPIRTGLHLVKTSGDRESAAPFIAIIERQVKHMVRLIDDLLDLSRIDTGKLEVRPEPADLVAVLREAIDTAQPVIEQRDQHLLVRLPQEPVPMAVDPVRMAQVFTNLLDNAAKFSPKGASLWLKAERRPEGFEVEVCDEGRGIEASQLDPIFEPFYQANRSVDRPTPGLGIGLSLVRRLVELHGGRVSVASEGPGRGSRFTVFLPSSLEILAAPAPRSAPAAERPARSAGSRRIVVVDDNRDAADTLAATLRENGYEVEEAFDGSHALQVIEDLKPDAALVDIGMPERSGYDVARSIRRHPWGAPMLLVAITGWGSAEDKRKALDSGFDHHLTKPVDFEEVVKLLHQGRRRVAASESK